MPCNRSRMAASKDPGGTVANPRGCGACRTYLLIDDLWHRGCRQRKSGDLDGCCTDSREACCIRQTAAEIAWGCRRHRDLAVPWEGSGTDLAPAAKVPVP